jgi:Zn-dependent M28 family amino/carboxypeptidase
MKIPHVIYLCLLLWPVIALAQLEISAVSVPAQRLKGHVYALTADRFAGRETGKPGQKSAAYYCGTSLKQNHLAPFFQIDSTRYSFLQTYPFESSTIRPYGSGSGGDFGRTSQNAFGIATQPTRSGPVLPTYKQYNLTNAPRTVRDSSSVLFGDNVAGVLIGDDLKQEIVVLSAHYDHLGRQEGVFYPGADDNASGTATVLSIAAVFDSLAQAGIKPRRSVLFVLFSGEEGGLVGSQYFMNNSRVSPTQFVADLNIDMVGRVDYAHRRKPDYCYITAGGSNSNLLRSAVTQANQQSVRLYVDLSYDSKNGLNQYFPRSDQLNFVLAGVPAVWFFDGQHPDYHQPTDTADRINYDVLQKRATLVFQTAWLLANPPK